MLRIIIFLLIFIASFTANGVPAYPRKIKIKTEDGTIYITLQGDEYTKWALTEDNYTLLPDSSSWVYAQEDESGFAIPSTHKITDSKSKLKIFLSTLKKNIPVKEVLHTQIIQKTSHQQAVSKSVSGYRKALVILMQFPDCHFTKTYEELDDLFNKTEYATDGAKGSVHDFFNYASYGQLNFTCDLVGPFTAEHNMPFYGTNSGIGGYDINPYTLFLEAIEQAAKEKNLSEYDGNGDGYVDNIHIVFAGYGEEAGAPSYTIWSHEMTFSPITIQNMMINKYSCAPELRGNSGTGISRIGPHCHEMGHALGAMDYYDTNYSTDGYYEGTGEWDIMASGSWNNDGITPANFNPYVKAYNFGWCKIKYLEKGVNIIHSSNWNNNEIYRIDTPVKNEYYLLENRRRENFDINNPGEGLLIYHIHKDIENMAYTNSINSSHPQGCYIVCSQSTYPIPTSNNQSYGNINDTYCPFPGTENNINWNDNSTPSAFCWDGTYTGIDLFIKKEDDNKISITLQNETNVENESIWQENFDGVNVLHSWNEEILQGNNTWKILNTENEYTITDPLLPVCLNGKYAYIIRKDFLNNAPDINRLVSPAIVSHNYLINEITFFVHRKSTIKNDKNILNIYFRENADKDWISIGNCSKETNKWESFSYTLTAPVESVQLMFESKLYNIGSFSIDEIKIKGKATESTLSNTDIYSKNIYFIDSNHTVLYVENGKENDIIHIYDLQGKLCFQTHLSNKRCKINLLPGIYIGVLNHQNFKLIIP